MITFDNIIISNRLAEHAVQTVKHGIISRKEK